VLAPAGDRSIAGRRRQRPQLSIDIFCPQGAQQQTSRTPLLLSIDGTDRQTNGHVTVTQTLLRMLCGQRQKARGILN